MAITLAAFTWFTARPQTMAQPPPSSAERWLAATALPPNWEVPATRRTWEKRRAEIRTTLWARLGELPARPQRVAVTTLAREDRGDYVLEKFQFDNGAGATVPGYLFLPRRTRSKCPGILYCHWHGGQYDCGKDEMLRTNAVPVAPGPALAREGYAVIGIDAHGFGERNGAGPGGSGDKGAGGEMTAAKFNLWMGRTLWGMMLRDDLLALDYLASRPEVEATRIGVTGISMGATRTWWLMALEERLRAGVAVACMTRYTDLIRAKGLRHHGIYYFVPGLLKHFDSEAVMALAAPRPLLFLTGDKDPGSPLAGIRRLEQKIRPAYALYRQPAHFRSIVYPDLGHAYLPEMWVRTLRWMNTHVKHAK